MRNILGKVCSHVVFSAGDPAKTSTPTCLSRISWISLQAPVQWPRDHSHIGIARLSLHFLLNFWVLPWKRLWRCWFWKIMAKASLSILMVCYARSERTYRMLCSGSWSTKTGPLQVHHTTDQCSFLINPLFYGWTTNLSRCTQGRLT